MPIVFRNSAGGTIADATANPEDVLNGKVFYNNNGKQVGSMTNEYNFTFPANIYSSRSSTYLTGCNMYQCSTGGTAYLADSNRGEIFQETNSSFIKDVPNGYIYGFDCYKFNKTFEVRNVDPKKVLLKIGNNFLALNCEDRERMYGLSNRQYLVVGCDNANRKITIGLAAESANYTFGKEINVKVIIVDK